MDVHNEFYRRINAIIASGYLLLGPLLLPAVFYNPLPITIGKFVLIFILIILNRKRLMNANVFAFVCVYLIVICVKCIVSPGSVNDYLAYSDKWLSVILNGIAMIFVFSAPFSLKVFMEWAVRISILACVIIDICIYDDNIFSQMTFQNGWYMLLGFQMLLPINILLTYLFVNYPKINKNVFMVYLLTLLYMILYANRGAIFIHLLLVLSYMFFKMKKRIKIILIFVMSVVVINAEKIMMLFGELLIGQDFDFSNSAMFIKLIKFNENQDLDSFSSGRFDIWEYAWETFLDNPIFGNDIGFIHIINSSCHNILLEILSTYGIFVFLFFVAYVLYYLINSWRWASDVSKIYLCMFISFSMPSLTSGSIFLETGFMAMLGTMLSQKFNDSCCDK